MLLKYFYDEQLAQASYLVGCAATGEALVVDPMRDVEPYLALAAKEGLRITHVTETHIHADFVSGSRELAARTGATIYLSDMGPAEWKYAYAHEPNVMLVRDGDHWMVGNIRVEVLHTPGHTPEHIAFLITDTAGADAPMGLFSGDFLFVGDVGRPDLLEEAAGISGTKEPGAREMFHTLERSKTLPDYLQVWPAHGAGSACGKALGAIPSSTLGYEKRFNPAFHLSDEASFVDWLLSGQPEAPRYFARMKHVNKVGPVLLSELPPVRMLDRSAIDAALANGDLVIDLRPQAAYRAAHIPGSLSVPATTAMYSTYIGWFVDYTRPTYLVLPDDADLTATMKTLRAIGIDHVPGFLPAAAIGANTASLPAVTVAELAERLAAGDTLVLDVRGQSEYAEVHLPNALHVPLGFIPQHLAEIPRNRPIIVHCASGYRAQIGASLLRCAGFANVATLADADGEWKRLVQESGEAVKR
jgi:hydroxyacylglutathione hydrolase